VVLRRVLREELVEEALRLDEVGAVAGGLPEEEADRCRAPGLPGVAERRLGRLRFAGGTGAAFPNDVATGETGFEIERRRGTGTYQLLTTAGADATGTDVRVLLGTGADGGGVRQAWREKKPGVLAFP
jgi:hypothetical protein